MAREQMKSSTDKKVFKHTADKTKKVNIPGKIYRGGYRF